MCVKIIIFTPLQPLFLSTIYLPLVQKITLTKNKVSRLASQRPCQKEIKLRARFLAEYE